jgi:hypothetical protein
MAMAIFIVENIIIVFIVVKKLKYLCAYIITLNIHMKPVLSPFRDKIYGGAWSIHDPEVLNYLEEITPGHGNLNNFVNDYFQWFKNDKNIVGIDKFRNLNFSAGTTETFHMFYFKHLRRRLRLFPDEYFYHHIMARNYFEECKPIDLQDLHQNDVVVMSCPFSGTGGIPKNFYAILQRCSDLEIPVMIDMAYINLTDLKEINLDYDCIETVTTSLSKYFPVENLRIGMRMERTEYDDPMVAYNQNNYVNLDSVKVGHLLIEKFDSKWLVKKYRPIQHKQCLELGVNASESVIFGIDNKGLFDEYNRGGEQNRLCFSRVWDGRVHA